LLSYVRGLAERNRIAREWCQFQERYALVLGPVSTSQPFELGYDTVGRQQVGDILRSMRLVTAINLLGLPAVAMPVRVVDGVPQAVQIIGPRYHEDLCLDAAEAIERTLGVPTPIEPKS
jgi:amidase